MTLKSWSKARLLALVHKYPSVARKLYQIRHGPIGSSLADAFFIPSWLGREEALALARECQALPVDAVIVEIGSCLGKSAIMMAGAMRARVNGRVHCIDPFDGSGDAFSVPLYRQIAGADTRTLRQRFDANIAHAGLTDWIDVHEGTAASVAATWNTPIDLLFIDGDQSPEGAGLAYELWHRFLRTGGVIALHNSAEREYAPGHDGIYRLAVEKVRTAAYSDVRVVETTTFARKVG